MNLDKKNAGFGKRTLAFIFDLLMINIIVFWPFQKFFERYLKQGSFAQNILGSELIFPSKVYFVLGIISVLALLYFTFFEYYIQQTPGMTLFNLRVVSPNNNLGFFKVLIRNIFILPFFPFYILWIVDPIYLAFYKERFLEKITQTSTLMKDSKMFEQVYKLQKV